MCRSSHRVEIEQAIAQGRRDIDIVKDLPDSAAISVRNVAEHRRRGHQPRDFETVREVVEIAEAGLRDADLLWTTNESTVLVLARKVVQEVYRRAASGEIDFSMKDGIRCAGLILKSEIERARFERGAATEAVQALLVHVRDVMDEDQYAQFKKRVYDDKHMAGLGQLDGLKMPKNKPGSTWAI